ncbi:putative jacalin-like lectin domain-containing protein [Plasmopara halstedii]
MTSDQIIASVTIWAAQRIHGVTLKVSAPVMKTLSHGVESGDAITLPLRPDEYITTMETHEGSWNGHTCIYFLGFSTNKGVTVVGGTRTNTNSIVPAPKGYQIGGFLGRSGIYLEQLGVIWQTVPDSSIKNLPSSASTSSDGSSSSDEEKIDTTKLDLKDDSDTYSLSDASSSVDSTSSDISDSMSDDKMLKYVTDASTGSNDDLTTSSLADLSTKVSSLASSSSDANGSMSLDNKKGIVKNLHGLRFDSLDTSDGASESEFKGVDDFTDDEASNNASDQTSSYLDEMSSGSTAEPSLLASKTSDAHSSMSSKKAEISAADLFDLMASSRYASTDTSLNGYDVSKE